MGNLRTNAAAGRARVDSISTPTAPSRNLQNARFSRAGGGRWHADLLGALAASHFFWQCFILLPGMALHSRSPCYVRRPLPFSAAETIAAPYRFAPLVAAIGKANSGTCPLPQNFQNVVASVLAINQNGAATTEVANLIAASNAASPPPPFFQMRSRSVVETQSAGAA